MLKADPQSLISRRGFLHAATAATVTAPIWLNLNPPGASAGPGPEGSAGDYFADSFGISKGDVQRIISRALSGGGDYCDVYFQHSQGNWIVMEDGKINRAYTSVKLGVGVRVIRGEETGYSFTQVLELPAMLEAADTAASLARAGKQPAGAAGIEARRLEPRPGLDLYPCRPPWHEVGQTERIGLLRKLGSRMSQADPAITKTILQFFDGASQTLLANSDGVMRADFRPRTSLSASCVAEKKGRRESNFCDITARAGMGVFTEEKQKHIAEEAARRTLGLFEARPAPAGEMPCVLAPGSSGILLHEAIGHGLEADFNRWNISTYSGRLGQKVAGEQVTVVDDGTIPGSHGAINFDDEGADSQRTVLVERGVLKGYLHDRLSARWFKARPTGNGRRQSFQYPPMPRMRATFMEPGPYDPAEVIGAVKKGIYASQLTNGQVNIGAGDFSFYVKSGWAIENGKLTHPIKDVNLIGNGPKVLGSISMAANDPALAESGFICGKNGQTVPVSQGLPTTLVSAINVGGAK